MKSNSILSRVVIPFGFLVFLLAGVGLLALKGMGRIQAAYEGALRNDWSHVILSREAILRETIPLLKNYHDAWNAFAQFQVEGFDQAAERTRQHYARVRTLFLLLSVVSAAVAVSIAIFVSFGLKRESARREEAEK